VRENSIARVKVLAARRGERVEATTEIRQRMMRILSRRHLDQF